MPKHTPGPWVVNGRSVETHRPHGPSQHVSSISDERQGVDEGEANANLIAAAPDMLEALRDCAAAIKHSGNHDGPPSADEVMDLAVALSKARAAIAKAEGR